MSNTSSVKTGPAATPMAFVRGVAEAYRRRGLAADAALRAAQIAPADLARVRSGVTAGQFEALCAHAMQELDDEALGWFSRPMRWGSYGLMARASLHAPNLGVALARWARHHRLLCDDLRHQLDVEGDTATLSLQELGDLGPLREFCLVSTLRFVHGYACWAIDSRLSLDAASFPYAPPAHAQAYPLMFRGTLQFGAARAALQFDARYLALPLVRDEAALSAMLRRPLPLTVLQYRRDRLLVQQVRSQLRRADGSLTADQLAHALRTSVRTLHRQLQEEGASFQALKDEVRHERAVLLLKRSGRPLKQIAREVGFRNEKSFSRAFKAWTGQTPGALRQGSAQTG